MKRAALALFGALTLTCMPVVRAADAAAAAPALKVPQADMERLLAAYAIVKQNYVGEVDDKVLFDGALSGMLAALDAHSRYLDKDAMRDVVRENSGEYVGIGIEVEGDRDRLRVVAASEGSPAERAGVRPGDVIASVDGTPVAGLATDDVARRMHGASGTIVAIGIARHDTVETLRITRAELHNDTVHVRMAAPGIAWIRIAEFGGATAADLAAALKHLDGKDAPRGLILDLRNDPGGLVAAGVAVAGAFLPPGTMLFSARGRAGGANATVTVDARYYREPDQPDVLAGLPAWTRTVPLTVLVNGSSASAAELVTGALQDQHRATVIGTRTFGKGSIQSVVPLDTDTGAKFTVARYFTPAGHEIQARGITPDIVVAPAAAANDDLLLREADLARHLPATQPADTPADARTPAESTRTFGTRADKALQTAVAVLTPAHKRTSTLAGLLRRWSGAAVATGAP
ncbi:S41 family peptidase [Massilia pinisoli]|uniref:S41 family peptidase n=1 Tax=Massilia pinisoli TaxID=1772194 RepID=A0ABT1ZMI1_9BURK|nr:S41 family peptidase [Massilia pinisoli]